MFLFFGQRTCGVTRRHGGTYVATRFFHVNLLPLVPTRSFLVLGDGGAVALPLDPVSVAAGYLRSWGLAGVIVAVFLTVSGLASGGVSSGLALSSLALGGLGLALGASGAEQRARQDVYARYAGHAVDVALLPAERRRALSAELRARVTDRARSHVGTTYRESLSPDHDWAGVALHPTVHDAELVAMALTLARLEGADATGEDRRRLRSAHDALWRRLRQL